MAFVPTLIPVNGAFALWGASVATQLSRNSGDLVGGTGHELRRLLGPSAPARTASYPSRPSRGLPRPKAGGQGDRVLEGARKRYVAPGR